MDRLKQLEKFKESTKKKEKEKYKWNKTGTEKQFDFNSDVKEIISEKLREALKASYDRRDIPAKVEDVIKEGEKKIDDQNHKLKIADEFGFKAMDEFDKEELARDDKEEKKIKKLRKKKEEREEKAKEFGRRRFPNYRDRRFGDRREDNKDNKERRKDKDDVKCYNCQQYGHIAKNCSKPRADGRRGGRH